MRLLFQALFVGKTVGLADGFLERNDGFTDGFFVIVAEGRNDGFAEGFAIGLIVGLVVDFLVGRKDGFTDGFFVIIAEGEVDGLVVCFAVGSKVVLVDGFLVWKKDGFGDIDTGFDVGCTDGFITGLAVGGNETKLFIDPGVGNA